MNSKMTTNSQLSTTEPKQQQQQLKHLSKQLKQEQNCRNGDHMQGYKWVGGGRRIGGQVQGIRSINSRYKIDRGRLRMV